MLTVPEIYVTYPGVGSLRGDPRRLRGDPQPPAASCHALVTAGGVPEGGHIVVSGAVTKKKVGGHQLSFSIAPWLNADAFLLRMGSKVEIHEPR